MSFSFGDKNDIHAMDVFSVQKRAQPFGCGYLGI
jgi:hypothetical protein